MTLAVFIICIYIMLVGPVLETEHIPAGFILISKVFSVAFSITEKLAMIVTYYRSFLYIAPCKQAFSFFVCIYFCQWPFLLAYTFRNTLTKNGPFYRLDTFLRTSCHCHAHTDRRCFATSCLNLLLVQTYCKFESFLIQPLSVRKLFSQFFSCILKSLSACISYNGLRPYFVAQVPA